MSRTLTLIGIGAGDPDWMTLEAVAALQRLDVLFVVLKQDDLDDLVEARRVIIDRHRTAPVQTVELRDPPRPWRTAPDYRAAVTRWREQRLNQWSAAIASELGDGQTGGFLVWGDPSLFESTLAIVQDLISTDIDPVALRVIPGISCVHALTARFQIPLNRQGHAVQITPARLLHGGMPAGVDDVVTMLDGQQTFAHIDPTGLDIYWGAYLGTDDEILICGDLATTRQHILEARADAVARKGWMFDTYLLRRRHGENSAQP